MLISEEISLLIKSKYPLVYIESNDEEYVIEHLGRVASQLQMTGFQWSVTNGLRRDGSTGSYYLSQDPAAMLRLLAELLRDPSRPELFILKDFDKYLDNPVIVRQLKDAAALIKGTPSTIVITAAEYKLPAELEPYAARISGVYPSEQEIDVLITRVTDEAGTAALPDEIRKKILSLLKGLTAPQIRNVLRQCILDDHVLDAKDIGRIQSFKKELFDREGMLEYCLVSEQSEIANFTHLKQWLAERAKSFSDPRPVLPPPKGVLLMGVQGCGKSLASKVIARELHLPLYRFDLGAIYSKYIGESEQNLVKAFKTIERLSPLCVWIDEIEKIFAASGGEMDGGVSKRILASFLTWMQERTAPCFIIATANDVYSLPPEFLRKGRFDEIFFVDLPDGETRESLISLHLSKRNLEPRDFDIPRLRDLTEGFNGAEIEQAIIAALYRAGSTSEKISTQHVVDQVGQTKPLSVLKKEDIDALRAWAKDRTVPA